MEKIRLTGENDEIELYILESTRLGGADYVLASDVETGDGEAYILKDVSQEGSPEAVYSMVTDEHELDYLAGIFAELLEDVDLKL